MLVRQQSDKQITIDAPAKVNLYLEVLNRRPDGYHNINSLFQAVSLYDRLEFSINPQPQVRLEVLTDVDLSTGEDNLIGRAYELLRERFHLERGLDVRLHKHIPIAAGLGGGSSDAAATILACNEAFGLGLSRAEMSSLGLAIGSDVPFFFSCGQALVTERGDRVEDVDLPLEYHLVLVTPGLGVPTGRSYEALKRGLTNCKEAFRLEGCRRVEDLIRLLRLAGNDFEEVQVRSWPELGRIKQELLEYGADIARMSGSGPTMLGLFAQAPRTEVVNRLRKTGWQVHAVTPIRITSTTNQG